MAALLRPKGIEHVRISVKVRDVAVRIRHPEIADTLIGLEPDSASDDWLSPALQTVIR